MVATCLSSLTKRTNSSTVQFSQRRRNTKQRLAARHQSQETPSKRLQSLEDTTDLESQSPSITTSSTFQLIFTFFFSFLFFCFSQIFLLSIFFFSFSFFFLLLLLSLSLSLSLFLFLSPPQLRCTSSRFSRFFHWIKNTLTSLLFVLREFPSYEFGDEAVINHRARFSLLVPGETKELPAATSYPIPVNQFRLNSLNSLDWAHLFGWLSNRVEC